MVDIQVAEGMTDAQKSACDIVSQMCDEERTRMMNLLTKQWGSQPLAIKDIPEKTDKEEIEAEMENKKRKREESKPTREAKEPATTPATIDQAQLDKANIPMATQQSALTELRRMY